MTAKKQKTPPKVSKRLMKEDRAAVVAVLHGIAAGLRSSAKTEFEKAVAQTIKDGTLESKDAHQRQLHCLGMDIAAHAVEERIGKLRKTWQ